MTTPFLFLPVFRAFDASGAPLAGGLLYTYQAGTTTPKNTFSDPAGVNPNTNPITLDATGSATVRLEPGAYHFVLTDISGTTTLWDEDYYTAPYLTQQDIGGLLYPLVTPEIIAGVTPANMAYPVGDIRRYGADPTLPDNQNAINAAIGVLNAGGGGGELRVAGGTYLTSPLANISVDDAVVRFVDGSVIKVAANTWLTTGDGTTFLNLTGNRPRLYNVVFDGNQSAFAPAGAPVGRLLQWTNNVFMENCRFINSPSFGVRSGGTGGRIIGCRFDDNANLGMELDVANNQDFIGCSFDRNGYGFQKTLATNAFASFGIAIRYRSHHISFTDCRFNQNGRDGANVNQGSYAVSFINCRAWMNGDGGFTLANNNSGTGQAGESETPFDCEYINCESYNNWASGLASYCASKNITVKGGRYYNNNRLAGTQPDSTSFVNGVYFAAGSAGIVVDTKAYDDRQLLAVQAASVIGGTATVSASGWAVGTIANYPTVAFYNANLAFQGYASLQSEVAGQVTCATLGNNGVTLSSITAGWFISGKLQHNGVFLDNNTQGQLHCDGWGFYPGLQPYYGHKIAAGYNANGQNILLPQVPLDPNVELLLNTSFESDTTNWSLANGASGGSSGRVTTTKRSVGSLQLTGGTTVATVASATLDSSHAAYSSLAFVEYSFWVYCTVPLGGGIILNWTIPGPSTFTSSVYHPGGAVWKLLRVGAFLPANLTSLSPQLFAQPNDQCFFDVGSLRVKMISQDDRERGYPTRSPLVAL